jgi:hypothetical protein
MVYIILTDIIIVAGRPLEGLFLQQTRKKQKKKEKRKIFS